jgi:PAS domain S-box-containing protein
MTAPEDRPAALVVDDDRPILDAVRRLLRHEPFDILATEDPRQGLEWLSTRPVRLIIADQRMPEMRGTDLLRIVRREFPAVRRVLLTGFADLTAVGDAINEAAICRLITKPWDDDEFRRSVRDLMRPNGHAPPARPPDDPAGVARALLDKVELPMAALSSDADRVLYHNDAFQRLLGVGETTVGARARDVLPADVCARAHALAPRSGDDRLDRVLVAGTRATVRLRRRGDLIELRIRRELPVEPPRAAAPLPVPRRGEAVHERPGLLDAVLSATVDPVLVVDRDGRCVYANAACACALGAERARLVGRAWDELNLEPDLRRRLAVQRDQVFESGRLVTGEALMQTPYGERDFEIMLNPIHDDGGAVEFVVFSLRDVTERKRVEDDLREISLALENAVEGIALLDGDSRYIQCNKAYASMLGREPEVLAGQEWLASFASDDHAALGAAYRQMLASEKAEAELRALRADGSELPVHVVIVRAYDRHGHARGHYWFMKDVAERRRAQTESRRIAGQLLQGQKLQALGQLAAGIAHEINNPVGFLLTNLSAMKEYLDELARFSGEAARAGLATIDPERLAFLRDDFRKALEDSHDGARRIRDIVRNLRDFAHVDEGGLKDADLNALLEDVIRLCWNELKYKATIHRDYGAIPRVRCHPQRIEQVFMNVLVNAAQAIDVKGDVQIVTRQEDGTVAVRISDAGRGIDPQNLGRIFEPFFTTKPVGLGTGLGLHVAYQIVTAHGGTIAVTSRPGQGTEFVVRLPIAGPGTGASS